MSEKHKNFSDEYFEFRDDHDLESISLDELENERQLELEQEEGLDDDFYLPPEQPLKF